MLDRQEKLYERQSELKVLLEDCEASGSPRSDGTTVSVENCSGPFEWDSQADDVRFNIFGISKYRANQREVSAIPVCLPSISVIIFQKFVIDLESWIMVSWGCSQGGQWYIFPPYKCRETICRITYCNVHGFFNRSMSTEFDKGKSMGYVSNSFFQLDTGIL